MRKCLLIAFAGLMGAVWAEDAYIQSDGTQYIKTGYYANPTTKIVCDFAYVEVSTLQQRIFGAASDDGSAGLSLASYINGSGQYAWKFSSNASGGWTGTGITATTDRRTITLDGPNNMMTLTTGGAVTKTATI